MGTEALLSPIGLYRIAAPQLQGVYNVPESTSDLHTDVSAALDQIKKRRNPRPDLSPTQWEALARYVEGLYTGYNNAAVKGEKLLAGGFDSVALANNVIFWRVAAAVAAKIAWTFRTGKRGPNNSKTPIPLDTD